MHALTKMDQLLHVAIIVHVRALYITRNSFSPIHSTAVSCLLAICCLVLFYNLIEYYLMCYVIVLCSINSQEELSHCYYCCYCFERFLHLELTWRLCLFIWLTCPRCGAYSRRRRLKKTFEMQAKALADQRTDPSEFRCSFFLLPSSSFLTPVIALIRQTALAYGNSYGFH